MLKGPNQAWPYTTAAANGTSAGTYRTYSTRDTNPGTANGLFCNNCHVLNGNEHTRATTTSPCVTCHIRVPHGGKVSRLLRCGCDGQRTCPLPARRQRWSQRRAASDPVQQVSTGSYSESNCAQSGCSSHGTVTSPRSLVMH